MRTLLATLCLLLAAPAFAAPAAKPAPAAKAAQGSPAKIAKIHQLLAVTHADKMGQAMLESLRPAMPPAQFESLAKIMKPGDMIELLIPVYDKHFTEADLDGLLAFYGTPLGQKLIAEMPGIAQESSAIGMAYAREKLTQARDAAPAPAPAK